MMAEGVDEIEKDLPAEERRTGDFVDGADYYFEEGLMVLTSSYLLKRGYCCENGCRHCPYTEKEAYNR